MSENGSGKAHNGSKTVAGEGNVMHDLSVGSENGKSLYVYVNSDFIFFAPEKSDEVAKQTCSFLNVFS